VWVALPPSCPGSSTTSGRRAAGGDGVADGAVTGPGGEVVGGGTAEDGAAADGDPADAGPADVDPAEVDPADTGGGAATGEDGAAGGTDEPHPASSRTSPPAASTRATAGTGPACQFQQRRTRRIGSGHQQPSTGDLRCDPVASPTCSS
jgi:hypothetical protein